MRVCVSREKSAGIKHFVLLLVSSPSSVVSIFQDFSNNFFSYAIQMDSARTDLVQMRKYVHKNNFIDLTIATIKTYKSY